jgi:hypothetical protein
MHGPDRTQTNPSKQPTAALTKLRGAVFAMRLLSAAYLVLVAWYIQNWWLDGDKVVRLKGYHFGLDLGAMQAWQRHAAMGLDVVAWASLVHKTQFPGIGAQDLLRCAWWGLACEALSVLSRPLQSYLLTLHLEPANRQWRWAFHSADVQSVILCLALVIFALMYAWTLEVAEENRSFV